MKRLVLLVLTAFAVTAPAEAQIIEGPPIDCRVLMPHTGMDAHRATDYVEVSIVNTNYAYQAEPHPEGEMFVRDAQKVLWRVKDLRFSNFGDVPVFVCEWDEKKRMTANVWKT